MASVTGPTASSTTPMKPVTPKKTSSGVKPVRRSALANITNDFSPAVGLAEASAGLLKISPPAGPQEPPCPTSGESLLREQAKKSLLESIVGETLQSPEEAKDSQVEVVLDFFGPPESIVGGTVALESVCSMEKQDGFEEAVDLSGSSSVVACEDSSSACGSTHGGGKCGDDDCSSAWSIQANGSCLEEEEEKQVYDVEEETYYEVEEFDYPLDNEEQEKEEDEYLDYDVGNDDVLDSLCEGLAGLRFARKEPAPLPAFAGKHTRFVYNSDGEIEEEEEILGEVSPSKVLLKGMPVPQGKHLRFSEDDADEA